MPLLNASEAIYLGDRAVDRVYRGAVQVWPASAPELVEDWFGTKLTNGGGNWGLSADRAMLARSSCAAWLTQRSPRSPPVAPR